MIELWRPDELVKREQCPICAAPPGRIAARRVDGLAIRDCSSCKALFVDPTPDADALARCYGPDYFTAKHLCNSSGRYGRYSFVGPNKSYQISDADICAGNVPGHADIVANFNLRGKSVLEIGCATGALLQSLKKYRPARLVGIDIAPEQIAFGKQHYKDVELHCGTPDKIHSSESEFDLILMFDVLEHTPNPSTMFAQVCRSLRPGGSIFLRTPNADAFEITRRRWSYLFWGLEHVVYVRAATLRWLGSRNGVSIRKVWSEGCPGAAPFPYWHSNGLVRLLRYPHIVISNHFYQLSVRRFEQRGYGLDLLALVAK